MANEENLIPKTSDQSREEAKRNGSKGGKASGAARRRKKAMKDSAKALLSMNVCSMNGGSIDKIKALLRSFGYDDDKATVQDAILISWLLSAMKGDVQAGKLLRDTAGESPDMEIKKAELRIKKQLLELKRLMADGGDKDGGGVQIIDDL